MKITGQILKENRERKQMTIAEVSLATKITTKTIAAIEDGNPDNLPPKTFLRGFVRSYALYLGLDVDEILRTFQEEMGTTLAQPTGTSKAVPPAELAEKNSKATESISREVKSPNEMASSSRVHSPISTSSPSSSATTSPRSPDQAVEMVQRSGQLSLTKYLIGGLVVVLIGLIIFFKEKMDSYDSERAAQGETTTDSALSSDDNIADSSIDGGPIATDLQAIPGATPIDGVIAPTPSGSPVGPQITPSAAASPTVIPTPTPTPWSTPTPTPAPSPTRSPSPKPTATAASPSSSPSVSPSPRPTSTPTPAPKATPSTVASPAATSTPRAAKPTEILIEALDNVEIEVTVDNDPPRSVRLRADQIQAIQAQRKAIVRFSDGGAVNVLVNGTDRGVPGDLGRPLRIEYP